MVWTWVKLLAGRKPIEHLAEKGWSMTHQYDRRYCVLVNEEKGLSRNYYRKKEKWLGNPHTRNPQHEHTATNLGLHETPGRR